MTPELLSLTALAVLHYVTIIVAQQFLNRDAGHEANVGTRENLEEKLSETTLRLRRATANFVENIGPFIIAILVITLAQKTSTFTAILAWTYVALRALYVVAYARAWVPQRSFIWLTSTLCTLALLVIGIL
ncbi:MAPEG family protein [Neogemmobacter tilapiae]|uniref:MAPEG family protein n=1 Tax=Neogemmobacter tilapiae TaxID=875041 RepID=A0A918TL53_9RHOB|nr:MAPEG family protein [Gemmobacter tilapiae]GHC52949.1 hypothetical protein GCM10007315_14430 [Gemmobacter tilapiae]